MSGSEPRAASRTDRSRPGRRAQAPSPPRARTACSWPDHLLGPAGGPDEELTERNVRDRYLVGVLAPRPHVVAARERGRTKTGYDNGWSVEEFDARMRGQPYEAGGIRATVGATRAATDGALLKGARRLASEALRSGTTTHRSATGSSHSRSSPHRGRSPHSRRTSACLRRSRWRQGPGSLPAR